MRDQPKRNRSLESRRALILAVVLCASTTLANDNQPSIQTNIKKINAADLPFALNTKSADDTNSADDSLNRVMPPLPLLPSRSTKAAKTQKNGHPFLQDSVDRDASIVLTSGIADFIRPSSVNERKKSDATQKVFLATPATLRPSPSTRIESAPEPVKRIDGSDLREYQLQVANQGQPQQPASTPSIADLILSPRNRPFSVDNTDSLIKVKQKAKGNEAELEGEPVEEQPHAKLASKVHRLKDSGTTPTLVNHPPRIQNVLPLPSDAEKEKEQANDQPVLFSLTDRNSVSAKSKPVIRVFTDQDEESAGISFSLNHTSPEPGPEPTSKLAESSPLTSTDINIEEPAQQKNLSIASLMPNEASDSKSIELLENQKTLKHEQTQPKLANETHSEPVPSQENPLGTDSPKSLTEARGGLVITSPPVILHEPVVTVTQVPSVSIPDEPAADKPDPAEPTPAELATSEPATAKPLTAEMVSAADIATETMKEVIASKDNPTSGLVDSLAENRVVKPEPKLVLNPGPDPQHIVENTSKKTELTDSDREPTPTLKMSERESDTKSLSNNNQIILPSAEPNESEVAISTPPPMELPPPNLQIETEEKPDAVSSEDLVDLSTDTTGQTADTREQNTGEHWKYSDVAIAESDVDEFSPSETPNATISMPKPWSLGWLLANNDAETIPPETFNEPGDSNSTEENRQASDPIVASRPDADKPEMESRKENIDPQVTTAPSGAIASVDPALETQEEQLIDATVTPAESKSEPSLNVLPEAAIAQSPNNTNGASGHELALPIEARNERAVVVESSNQAISGSDNETPELIQKPGVFDGKLDSAQHRVSPVAITAVPVNLQHRSGDHSPAESDAITMSPRLTIDTLVGQSASTGTPIRTAVFPKPFAPHVQRVPVYMKRAQVRSLTVAGELSDIRIGNTGICQAVLVGPNRLKLIAAGNGVTEMVIWAKTDNPDQPIRMRIFKVHVDSLDSSVATGGRTTQLLHETIRSAFPNCQVNISQHGSDLIVSGRCVNREAAERIIRLVRSTCLVTVRDELTID